MPFSDEFTDDFEHIPDEEDPLYLICCLLQPTGLLIGG